MYEILVDKKILVVDDLATVRRLVHGVLARIEGLLQGSKVDLVVSDLAPNLTGVAASDQSRSLHLCELVLEFACLRLKPRGALLVKVFQGAGYIEFLAEMRSVFASVVSRKPKASRGESAEMYLVGKGLKAQDSGFRRAKD